MSEGRARFLTEWLAEWSEDAHWEDTRARLLAHQERQVGYWLCVRSLAPRWRLYRWLMGYRAGRVCRVLWWRLHWRWYFRLRHWKYVTRKALGLSVARFHAAPRRR